MIDLDLVRAVATEGNRAQRSMGTQLVEVGSRGVTIALPWRADLADAGGGLAPGVLAALLDHACSLAALVALGDPARFGATSSLRVDHLVATPPHRGVQVTATTVHQGPDVVTVHGAVTEPDAADRLVATAVCKVAIAR